MSLHKTESVKFVRKTTVCANCSEGCGALCCLEVKAPKKKSQQGPEQEALSPTHTSRHGILPILNKKSSLFLFLLSSLFSPLSSLARLVSFKSTFYPPVNDSRCLCNFIRVAPCVNQYLQCSDSKFWLTTKPDNFIVY